MAPALTIDALVAAVLVLAVASAWAVAALIRLHRRHRVCRNALARVRAERDALRIKADLPTPPGRRIIGAVRFGGEAGQ